ncbi:hypothetical protein HMPREF1988_00235 [Porphyromonas gingivalis F0185]|nr:hypothetical protein HMPREF1988_00235 [Porphyromonas gingivalis F0185]
MHRQPARFFLLSLLFYQLLYQRLCTRGMKFYSIHGVIGAIFLLLQRK